MDGEFRRKTPRIEPSNAKGRRDAIGIDPLAPENPALKPKPCGDCGRLIPGDSVKCMYCGEGGLPEPDPGADAPPKPCRHCGYDMRGLKSNVCPECGKRSYGRSRRRQRDQSYAQDLYKQEVNKCLIYLAIGIGVTIALAAWNATSVMNAVWALVAFASLLATANVVYFLLGVVWVGLDGGLGLVAMRVCAATSVAYVGFTLASFVGRPLFFLIPTVPIVLYASLLWDLFDLDARDAFLVSVLTHVAFIAVIFTLGVYLAS